MALKIDTFSLGLIPRANSQGQTNNKKIFSKKKWNGAGNSIISSAWPNQPYSPIGWYFVSTNYQPIGEYRRVGLVWPCTRNYTIDRPLLSKWDFWIKGPVNSILNSAWPNQTYSHILSYLLIVGGYEMSANRRAVSLSALAISVQGLEIILSPCLLFSLS